MKHGLPDRAGRHDPASSVAQIALLFALPASLSRTRPSHPVSAWSVRSEFLLGVVVLQHALADFLEGHGEVVLRPALDEGRQVVAEGAFAELVVVVVDLPGALRGH